MIRAAFRSELISLWGSPVPYVTGAVTNAALGLLAVDTMQARQQAAFQPIVPIAGFLLLVAVPVLTMRTVADERRTGTLDVLLVARVPAWRLVVGKWLATFCTIVVLVAPLGLHVLLLVWWGDPDAGPVVSGLVGLGLFAAAAVAVGVATSSFTSSQAIAAVSALFILLASWFLRPGTSSIVFRTATARLSLNERLRSFAGGAIDTGDALFLVAVAVVSLLTAAAAVSVVGGRRPARAAGGALIALAVIVAVVQWNIDDRRRLIDLTSERSLTLSGETEDVLERIDDDVDITAFIRDDSPGRNAAAATLDRYEIANRRIRASIVDPSDVPGEVRRRGLDPIFGGVVIEGLGRTELVPSAIEQDLTLGLARLLRGDLPVLCLSRGHGELDPESRLPNGFSVAMRILADAGYDVKGVDLLVSSEVPEGCGALFIVAPAAALDRASEAVDDFIARGGGVAVFAESGFGTGLDDVLAEVGIELLGGVVVEGDPDSVFSGDPTAPIVRRYSSASPVVRQLPPTFFVTVGGVEIVGDEPGRTVARLADTSADSLLVPDDDSQPTPGPITVAVASESVANRSGVIDRRRVVAVADGDLVSNAFVDEAGNARFLVQIADWLTVDEDLVTVSSNLAAPRPLELTSARRDYARLLTAGLVPAAFLLLGAFVWVLRRSR